jgi:methionyl-tRNA formyltransferase
MDKPVSGKRFIFAGNRFFVLEEMLKQNLNVQTIFAVANSYLEKELTKRKIAFQVIANKKFLAEQLLNLDFDILISNGLPYILPINELNKKADKLFINIHPSYLPDLRGADPVPGALLYGRDSGATCHYMNETIDGGDIIEQIKIEYSASLDCALLYQLSFIAEREVFIKSLKRNFRPLKQQQLGDDNIYYTFKNEDLLIDFLKDAKTILHKVHAFNTSSKGAYFVFKGKNIKVLDAEIVDNKFLSEYAGSWAENQVVFNYENKILLKKERGFLKLKQLSGNSSEIKIGDILK